MHRFKKRVNIFGNIVSRIFHLPTQFYIRFHPCRILFLRISRCIFLYFYIFNFWNSNFLRFISLFIMALKRQPLKKIKIKFSFQDLSHIFYSLKYMGNSWVYIDIRKICICNTSEFLE
jgi:hypothetical protein